MARFQVTDNIELVKFNREVVRKGTVVAGPYHIDKVDHYQVKWDDQDLVQIMCDLTSTKYHYRLS
jgi:hypothetical protein